MPKIKLKEKSPFYEDELNPQSGLRNCDQPGCELPGEHRAPKDRALSEYYHFCAEHARAYNLRWNFFEGMSEAEIETHMYKDSLWDRPTWNFTTQDEMESYLRKKVRDNFFEEDGKTARDEEKTNREQREEVFRQSGTPEVEALAVMGLDLPIDLATIKKRYKELAKKHHPDANGGSKESEEIIKKINMAYTVLKVAYETFERLEKPS